MARLLPAVKDAPYPVVRHLPPCSPAYPISSLASAFIADSTSANAARRSAIQARSLRESFLLAGQPFAGRHRRRSAESRAPLDESARRKIFAERFELDSQLAAQDQHSGRVDHGGW